MAWCCERSIEETVAHRHEPKAKHQPPKFS
jgi:hypothetical protein